MDTFWTKIDAQLDLIESTKPATVEEIAAIMPAERGISSADGFFHGSGGDRTLLEALTAAGWKLTAYDASFFYVMRHPESGQHLTYIEGDIYQGDRLSNQA